MVQSCSRHLGGIGLAVGVGLIAGLSSSQAYAGEGHPERTEEASELHHHEEFPNLVGLRVGFITVFEQVEGESEAAPGLFVGVSYERSLIHNWLELEISLPVSVTYGSETKIGLPIDIHFKKPFHPTPNISPYIAVGPSFDVTIAPEPEFGVGASFAVGTYGWFSRRVGVDVEADYNIVVEDRKPVHELLLVLGPVFRL